MIEINRDDHLYIFYAKDIIQIDADKSSDDNVYYLYVCLLEENTICIEYDNSYDLEHDLNIIREEMKASVLKK